MAVARRARVVRRKLDGRTRIGRRDKLILLLAARLDAKLVEIVRIHMSTALAFSGALDDDTRRALDRYMAERRTQSESPYLFPGRGNKHLSTRAVEDVFRRYGAGTHGNTRFRGGVFYAVITDGRLKVGSGRMERVMDWTRKKTTSILYVVSCRTWDGARLLESRACELLGQPIHGVECFADTPENRQLLADLLQPYVFQEDPVYPEWEQAQQPLDNLDSDLLG